MNSRRIKPKLYRVEAGGEVWRVRQNDGGWWEIHCWAMGSWVPYCDYNKFNKKADAMEALGKRDGYWKEERG